MLAIIFMVFHKYLYVLLELFTCVRINFMCAIIIYTLFELFFSDHELFFSHHELIFPVHEFISKSRMPLLAVGESHHPMRVEHQ